MRNLLGEEGRRGGGVPGLVGGNMTKRPKHLVRNAVVLGSISSPCYSLDMFS